MQKVKDFFIKVNNKIDDANVKLDEMVKKIYLYIKYIPNAIKTKWKSRGEQK